MFLSVHMIVIFFDEIIDSVSNDSRFLSCVLEHLQLSGNAPKCLMISLDILDPLVDRCLSC